MAQKIVTLRTDDITGKEIPEGEGETIRFAVEGVEYEIDLDAKGAKKFHESFGFYIDHGRKVGRSSNVTPMRRTRKNDDIDNSAVRAWAESNGIEISARGRIKQEILDRYRAAMA